MAFDERLAERVREVLTRRRGIEEKKMFGGIGFLLNGNMCVGVWKEWLIVRLGPAQAHAALAQPFVMEFDITGRAMKGWAMIAPEGLSEDGDLYDWIQRASQFAGKLPPKA